MRVLFVGGGTLGSVTPLLAVAEELRASPDYRLPTTDYRFWGTRTGPERTLVEAAGLPFRAVPAGKLRRYFDVRNITDLFVMEWAFWVALARLLVDRPSVVVGAGSFVQVPVMWAAWFLRIPIIIHQLDVRPCLANRLCAPIARAITVTFPESAAGFGARAQVIGAPVRAAVLAARGRDSRAAKCAFGFRGDRPMLLVLGGSTGAQALNDMVAGAVSQLTAVADVVHVTGKGRNPRRHFDRSESSSGAEKSHGANEISRLPHYGGRSADLLEMTQEYRPFDLLTDLLPDALAAADLVVSRAGMGTIAELGALGKPTVLVPMPDTHQEENAAALERIGAVEVWHQRNLSSQVFADRIRSLLGAVKRRDTLGAAFARVFPSDAAVKLSEVMQETVCK